MKRVRMLAGALCAGLLAGCGGGAGEATSRRRCGPATSARARRPARTSGSRSSPATSRSGSGAVNRGTGACRTAASTPSPTSPRRSTACAPSPSLDQDFDGGQIAEQALDYLAEDKQRQRLVPRLLHRDLRGRAVRERHRRLAGRRQGRRSRASSCRRTRKAGTPPYSEEHGARRRPDDRPGRQDRQSAVRSLQVLQDVLVIQEGGVGEQVLRARRGRDPDRAPRPRAASRRSRIWST